MATLPWQQQRKGGRNLCQERIIFFFFFFGCWCYDFEVCKVAHCTLKLRERKGLLYSRLLPMQHHQDSHFPNNFGIKEKGKERGRGEKKKRVCIIHHHHRAFACESWWCYTRKQRLSIYLSNIHAQHKERESLAGTQYGI